VPFVVFLGFFARPLAWAAIVQRWCSLLACGGAYVWRGDRTSF
jgi:hypothetical protein